MNFGRGGNTATRRARQSYENRRLGVSFSISRENYEYISRLAKFSGVNRSHALDTILANYRSREVSPKSQLPAAPVRR